MSARIKIRLSFFIGISFLFFSSPLKVFAQEPIVQELIPGFDYVQFFQTNNDFGFTPQTIDPNNQGNIFGAYVIEPVGDRLYIGFSAGSPGNYDGALLAVYENGTLTPLRLCMDEACTNIKKGLTEQGLHDMTFVNGVLYVAGTDPCCSDDWTYGNIYTYIPGQNIIKHRNLPNVLHTLGLWVDPSNNNIYAATGAHTGDSKTWVGRVYQSTDGANSWTYSDVSNYRVYDILDFQNKLYTAVTNSIGSNDLYVSSNEGLSWEKVNSLPDNSIYIKQRLTPFNDFIIGSTLNSDGLFIVDKNGNASIFKFPGFIGAKNWNAFANENDVYFHVPGSDGSIKRSNDFIVWQTVLPADPSVISIFFWPEKNKLIVTTKGPKATIKLVDTTPLPQPPTPTPPAPAIVPRQTTFGPKGIPDASWDTASELLNILNQAGYQVSHITRYNNRWLETYSHGLLSGDFTIKAGEGYFLRYTGNPPDFNLSLLNYTDTYEQIYNFINGSPPLISFPQKVIEDNPILQDAKSALEDMNKNETNVTKMMYWNDQTQTYVDYEPENPFSQNFPLASGKGYLVSSNKSFTWELNGRRDLSPAPCTPLEALGDLDCSGKIDVADLSILLASFGKREGESSYNPKADLDFSKKINMADLAVLFSNLGKSQ